ncbi:MAG TPA: hypothetical protein DD713_00140 [Nitrospiraceae bacterium]|nr:hypothetical protein [Nitrospiraceae bacterium]
MRKIAILIGLLLTVLVPAADAADTARVITKESAIRADCKFFSPVRAKVKYNDTLEIISQEGDWFRVKFKNTKGCIHKSAIEEKTFKLSGLLGSRPQSATADEVSLAGKGFNPQVENSYKKKHPNLDFRTVDRIGEYTVSEGEMQSFITSGGLNLP